MDLISLSGNWKKILDATGQPGDANLTGPSVLPAVRSSVSSHRKPYSGTYAAPGHAFGEHVEPLDAQAVKR